MLKCLILNFIIFIFHTWPLFLFVNGAEQVFSGTLNTLSNKKDEKKI